MTQDSIIIITSFSRQDARCLCRQAACEGCQRNCTPCPTRQLPKCRPQIFVWLLQGVWKPRKIANPDYFLDESPLANIGKVGGVAIEIWTMDEGYLFDNVLIANDGSVAQAKRDALWAPKKEAEVGLSPIHAFCCDFGWHAFPPCSCHFYVHQ